MHFGLDVHGLGATARVQQDEASIGHNERPFLGHNAAAIQREERRRWQGVEWAVDVAQIKRRPAALARAHFQVVRRLSKTTRPSNQRSARETTAADGRSLGMRWRVVPRGRYLAERGRRVCAPRDGADGRSAFLFCGPEGEEGRACRGHA